MEFTLEEFDFHDRDLSHNIFVLGGMKTGKTTLIKKLIQGATSIVWTPHSQRSYASPSWETLRVSHEYDMDPFVHSALDTFPDAIQIFKHRASIAAQRDIDLPWTNVVIDDMIEEPDGIMSDEQYVDRTERWENNMYAKDVLANCRHWKMSFILASRYTLIQKPDLRHQLGYVFIFPDSIRNNKKRLHFTYQYYLNNRNIVSHAVYEECMNALENHCALVIDYLRGKIYYMRGF